MKYNLNVILIIALTCFYGCSKKNEEIPLLTMEELSNDLSQYETKTVDVYGEIIDNYHGAVICDESEELCLRIRVDAVPNYKLHKDHLYYEFIELSKEIGGLQKHLGKAKLMATLRGQVYYYTIQESGENLLLPHPPPARPPDLPLYLICFVLKQVLDLDVQTLAEEQ